jgi:hypothetical protein
MGKCVRTSIDKKNQQSKSAIDVIATSSSDLDLAKVRVNNDIACAQDNA